MNALKRLNTEIIRHHDEKNFDVVHTLIPQYAQHIVDRIRDNDRIAELMTDVREMFYSNIAPSEKFDILANWMIMSKELDMTWKANILHLIGKNLGSRATQLAASLISGSYFYGLGVKGEGKDEYPSYTATMRLREEDIIIKAISTDCVIDEYVKFHVSRRKDDESLYSSNYLEYCIKKDNIESFRYFLERNSIIDPKEKFEEKLKDAFFKVLSADSGVQKIPEFFDVLGQYGLDVDKFSPDVALADLKNPKAVSILIDHGFKIDNDFLFDAISKNKNDLAKFILTEHLDKIDINSVDKENNSFLHKALHKDYDFGQQKYKYSVDFELFAMLVDKGVNYSLKNIISEDVEEILTDKDSFDYQKCLLYLKSHREQKALNDHIDVHENMTSDCGMMSGL